MQDQLTHCERRYQRPDRQAVGTTVYMYCRQQRREKEKRQAQFIEDSYGFTKTLLDQQKSGTLSSPKMEVEEFVLEAYGHPRRDQGLGVNYKISKPGKPSMELNVKEPTLQEIQDIVYKSKTSAAPGPSGIPCKVNR